MILKRLLINTLVLLVFYSVAKAEESAAPAPCKKIAEVCEAAGFIKGDWKNGDGLWRDCVNPIIQGVKSAPGASKPLPIVDAKSISACKAKHPKFGGGKVGK